MNSPETLAARRSPRGQDIAPYPAFPEPLQQIDRTWARWRGQILAYFAGCDYFRLASHPQVLAAAREAIGKYGLNVAASRKTTGNHILYEQLELALADFFQCEAALLTSNGYLTNLAVMQGIAHRFTHIFIDERAHSSLVDAATAAKLPVSKFAHRNAADLRLQLSAASRPHPLVLTDGMFAHDGSVAPLAEYAAMLPPEGWLLVDDSHGAGVLGANGRGAHEFAGVLRERLIQTITLSKAFGSFGGAILGSREVISEIATRSLAVAGATPFPLPLAAAAIASCALLKNSEPRAALRANCALINHSTPILSVTPTSPTDQCELERALLAHGIFPSHIRYQNGPAQGFFRFAISSEHSRAQLSALAAALERYHA